jgi:hypothetical protein
VRQWRTGDAARPEAIAAALHDQFWLVQPSEFFCHELHEFSRIECENSWKFVTKKDGG